MNIRARLVNLIDSALVFEFSLPRQAVAMLIFLLAVALAFSMEPLFHLTRNPNWYWVDHLLYGLGFPFLVYAWSGSWRLAIATTLAWSVGNELWEDLLTRPGGRPDWDHLVADFVGVYISNKLFPLLRRRWPARPPKLAV